MIKNNSLKDKKENQDKKYNLKNNIMLISLVAMFLSLSIIFKYLGQLILITGFPLELELIIYIVGLVTIYNYKYKIIFLILAPLMWGLVVPPFAFNILQVIVEYFLPPLFFIIIAITWTLLQKKNKITLNIGLILAIILAYLVKCILHIIAGFYWWTPGDWMASFLINIQIIGLNLAFQLPISIIIINIIIKGKVLPEHIFKHVIWQKQKTSSITHEEILKKYQTNNLKQKYI